MARPRSVAAGWPDVIVDGALVLRPFRAGDADAWCEVRLANEAHLAPWEPTHPLSWEQRHTRRQFRVLRRYLAQEASTGLSLPFAIEVHGRVAGQVTVSRITRGVQHGGDVGYWVDGRLVGRGVVTRAVALVVDHAILRAGLHRLEVHVRPENGPSLRVMEKLGLRRECFHERYLHIDGRWCDHVGFAITAEEIQRGLASRVPAARL